MSIFLERARDNLQNEIDALKKLIDEAAMKCENAIVPVWVHNNILDPNELKKAGDTMRQLIEDLLFERIRDLEERIRELDERIAKNETPKGPIL